jgi:hypothetical protein
MTMAVIKPTITKKPSSLPAKTAPSKVQAAASTGLGSGKISGYVSNLNTMKKTVIGATGTAMTEAQAKAKQQSLSDFKAPVRQKFAPAKSVGGMYTRTSRVTADANANAQVSNETKFRTAMADFEKQKVTVAKPAIVKPVVAKTPSKASVVATPKMSLQVKLNQQKSVAAAKSVAKIKKKIIAYKKTVAPAAYGK